MKINTFNIEIQSNRYFFTVGTTGTSGLRSQILKSKSVLTWWWKLWIIYQLLTFMVTEEDSTCLRSRKEGGFKCQMHFCRMKLDLLILWILKSKVTFHHLILDLLHKQPPSTGLLVISANMYIKIELIVMMRKHPTLFLANLWSSMMDQIRSEMAGGIYNLQLCIYWRHKYVDESNIKHMIGSGQRFWSEEWSYLEHLSCDHPNKRGCDLKQRLMDSEEE